jgi:hypothetical protein
VYTEAITILRAVASDFYVNCWCSEIKFPERLCPTVVALVLSYISFANFSFVHKWHIFTRSCTFSITFWREIYFKDSMERSSSLDATSGSAAQRYPATGMEPKGPGHVFTRTLRCWSTSKATLMQSTQPRPICLRLALMLS